MNIGKAILGNLSKKTVSKTAEKVAVSLPADIVSLQKSVSEALSKNIGELEKYAKTELPQTISSQKSALEGLEQLSKNIKSML